MNFDDSSEDHRELERPRRRVAFNSWSHNWLVVAGFSIGLFLLTSNPLLAFAALLIRAGWPATRTAIWLRMRDPWRARGQVGFWFHLAMAGFCAAATGATVLLILGVIENQLNGAPNIPQFASALIVILAGCGASFVFGWIGIFQALRHGIRVYIVADLYARCAGDFSRITSLCWNPRVVRTLPNDRPISNPANYVMAVPAGLPPLVCWCVLLAMVGAKQDLSAWVGVIALGSLIVAVIVIAITVSYLSKRIIASTPNECWGVPVPEQTI